MNKPRQIEFEFESLKLGETKIYWAPYAMELEKYSVFLEKKLEEVETKFAETNGLLIIRTEKVKYLEAENKKLKEKIAELERDICYRVFLSSGHLYYDKVDLETATKAIKAINGYMVKYLPEKTLNQKT